MPGKPTLTVQVSTIREDQAALANALQELATHVEVLALAVRNRESVPQADLEETVSGLAGLRSRLAGIGTEETG